MSNQVENTPFCNIRVLLLKVILRQGLAKCVTSGSSLLFALVTIAQAGGLKDIKHVVLFMQENRAFDHVRKL